MHDLTVFWSTEYNGTGVDFDTTRKADAVAGSLRSDPIAGVHIVAPDPATPDECRTVHDAAYVDAVLTGEPRALASSAGIGWDPGFARAVLASSGGTRDAALTALRTGGVSGSLSSGLHHAGRARGRGFCTFNGLAIAALAARTAGAQRVAIVDFDAHCGGGTAELIRDLPGVEQVDVSVDPFDRYEPRPDAWLEMATADTYLDAVRRALEHLAHPGSIDLVIYNAGMDPHQHAGGARGIGTDVLARREHDVFAWAAAHDLPVAFVLAGGYTWGMTMADLVGLHRITIETAARHA